MKVEGARVRCNLRSRKMSPTRLSDAYGSQISYGEPSLLYTFPNLWIISQQPDDTFPYSLCCCVFLNPPPFVSFSPTLFLGLSDFLFYCNFHTPSSSSLWLGFIVISEGCKSTSRGRADGAALFKYLMELAGCADLIELGGELKVRFPKQRPHTQLGPLRDRGD